MTSKLSHETKELLSSIAEGDEKAFSLLYYEMLPVLHGYLLRLLKSETEVQDAIQLAFIRVWMNRDALPGIQNARSWISKIALNEAYKLLRSRLRISKNEVSDSGVDIPEPEMASDRISLTEIKKLIAEAIEELPNKRKLIFKMSREQGMKIPEIAAVLNLSPGYVKNALVLALQQLRKKLDGPGKILILLFILKYF